ncbi:MAG: terpene cyclase/mutase family protein, partial [Thermoleophilaceae bacterium]|nr:terpene cyclase/mutase family protein [Thermoleophilaceae bacterium]
RDLVAEIRGRRRGDGSIGGYVSYTAFGILALRSAGESAGGAAIRWLAGSQNADGGFGVARSTQSDTDMTGATLQALAVTGRANGGVARRAVAYLRGRQNRDGGFGQMEGRESNSQSTAYAVQGLLAVGSGGRMAGRGLAFIRRRQGADGSVAYSASSEQTPVWVTAQALMALRRAALPVATVARAPKPEPAPEATAAADEPAEPEEKAKKEKKEASKPAATEEQRTGTEASGDGGGRVQLDAEVEDGKKPASEAEPASESSGGSVAPWLVIGGAILLIAAVGPFRHHLLRLVRRS